MGDRENYMLTKTGKVVEEERMVDGETDKNTKTEKVDEEREDGKRRECYVTR
jgi:hypothetical protein